MRENRTAGYRSDLARFPGDPQAWVGTKAGVRDLIAQRRREGWGETVSISEAAAGPGARLPLPKTDRVAELKNMVKQAEYDVRNGNA